MKKILIPTDSLSFNEQAVDYAIKLFKNEHCDFYFLNTYNYCSNSLDALELLHAEDEWFDEPKEDSLQKLGDLIEKYSLSNNNPKHKFYAISECLDTIKAVEKHIEKQSIDLIILSANKDKKVDKVSTSILNHIRSCPVLFVSSNSEISEVLKITIVSDFQQKVNTEDLELFNIPQVSTNVKIQVFVLGKHEGLSISAKNNVQEFIEYLRATLKISVIVKYITSTDVLVRYANSHTDSIMCIIDKKPDLFRKIGLFNSNVMPTLNYLHGNTVLLLHQ